MNKKEANYFTSFLFEFLFFWRHHNFYTIIFFIPEYIISICCFAQWDSVSDNIIQRYFTTAYNFKKLINMPFGAIHLRVCIFAIWMLVMVAKKPLPQAITKGTTTLLNTHYCYPVIIYCCYISMKR